MYKRVLPMMAAAGLSSKGSNPLPTPKNVAEVVEAISGGLPGDASAAFTTRTPIYHRLAYPAAGALSFEFFTTQQTPFVTNFPGAGGNLPVNYAFSLLSVGIGLVTGIDVNGARVAAGAQSLAAATTAATVAEEVRTILEAPAEITLTVGEKEVLRANCLAQLPLGYGPFGSGGFGPTAGSNILVNNGMSHADNRFKIGPKPFPIMGGQQVRLSVRFQALLTMAGAGQLVACMDGFLSRPAGT